MVNRIHIATVESVRLCEQVPKVSFKINYRPEAVVSDSLPAFMLPDPEELEEGQEIVIEIKEVG